MKSEKPKTKPKARWWTVMLLYPNYLTDDYGADIFVEWALTAKPEDAVPIVQRKATEAQADLSERSSVDVADPADFRMIAVWPGRTTLALDGSNSLE